MTSARRAARELVLADVAREADRRKGIARENPDGPGAAYRREIARLWSIALKAVREAS